MLYRCLKDFAKLKLKAPENADVIDKTVSDLFKSIYQKEENAVKFTQ